MTLVSLVSGAPRTILLVSLLALGLAACGASPDPIGESEQAFAAGDDDGAGDPSDGSSSSDPNTPVSSDPQGGGSSGYPGNTSRGLPGGGSDGSPGCGEPGQTDPSEPNPPGACSEGVPRDPTGMEPCAFIVEEACFDSSASACACAGCAVDRCLVLESYPAQIRCQ